jgi:hypothetical protein
MMMTLGTNEAGNGLTHEDAEFRLFKSRCLLESDLRQRLTLLVSIRPPPRSYGSNTTAVTFLIFA